MYNIKYRAYKKELCGFNFTLNWNRTILLCTPCICLDKISYGNFAADKRVVKCNTPEAECVSESRKIWSLQARKIYFSGQM
jgi:hypothetical protein